jgi:hypothetical protein
MEEDLRSQLLGNAGLAALVSRRITWVTRPQGSELPAVVLQMVSGGRDYTTQGIMPLTGALVQIDCWGGSYQSAKLLSRAVIAALETLATPFQGAFVENERDSFERGDGPKTTTGPSDYYRSSLDVRVWHHPE